MNKSTLLLAVLVSSFIVPASFAATTNSKALLAAANGYRDAVVNFERVVRRTRGVRNADEHVVDKFEKETRKLVAAAQNPRHVSRVRHEWVSILPFQARAEQATLGKYSSNHELLQAWEYVLYAQYLFEEEFAFHLENDQHGNSVRKRINTTQPNRFLPTPPSHSVRYFLVPSTQNR